MNRRHIYMWVVIVIVLVILLLVYPTNIGSKKLLLPSVSNAYVYGSSATRFIPLGLADPTRAVLLSGYNQGDLISYVKFNLATIPRSNYLINIDVDSAELRLLASSAIGNQSKFFITVNSCDNNNWSDRNITYDNRVCPKDLKGEDSIVVNASSLPQITTWDVSNSVTNAIEKNQANITYAITTFPVLKDRDISEIITDSQLNNTKVTSVGIVHFWPSEETKLSETAVPTLAVNVVTSPKPIVSYLTTGITILLPILGILLTIIPFKQG